MYCEGIGDKKLKYSVSPRELTIKNHNKNGERNKNSKNLQETVFTFLSFYLLSILYEKKKST